MPKRSNYPKQNIRKEVQCQQCEQVQIIHRPKFRDQSAGHIKDLYCPACLTTTKHVEIGPLY